MVKVLTKGLPLLIATVVVLAIGMSALPDEPAVGVNVGEKAPDFTLPQVGGEPVNLYDVVAQSDVTYLFFFLAAS